MMKFSVVFEGCDFKGIKEATETANEINKIRNGIAPNTYLMLCIYAEKFMWEIEEDSDAWKFFNIGLNALEEMGYIEIEGEGQWSGEDEALNDYRMIWIMK